VNAIQIYKLYSLLVDVVLSSETHNKKTTKLAELWKLEFSNSLESSLIFLQDERDVVLSELFS